MPRMYGILAIGGWVAALVIGLLLLVVPKRAETKEMPSDEMIDQ